MSKTEEYLKNSIRKCQEGDRPYNEWVSTDCAKLAVEIAREEIYEWLKENMYMYNGECEGDRKAIINDLKQAMKDE